MSLPDGRAEHRSTAIQTELFRALAILRGLLVVYVVYLNVDRLEDFARPGLALAGTAVAVAWSGVAAAAYESRWRHRAALQLFDLGLVVALMLTTLLTHSEAMQARNAPTLVSFWACVPVLAIAASRGAIPAVGAALVVGSADLATRSAPSAGVLRTLMLLLIAAAIVGYGARLVERTSAAEIRAQRDRTALAERTRVYREIHDGVLQVLALTGRVASGRPGDPELEALAHEAVAQEAALRRVMQDSARLAERPAPAEEDVDLVTALGILVADLPDVELAVPAHGCPLPTEPATELVAAAREALRNVDRHCPAGTRAWVFLEAEPDGYRLSVRDDGPGIPDGRLEAALAVGHRGVSGSIRERMTALGGTADLFTGADGTEWELWVPLERTDGR